MFLISDIFVNLEIPEIVRTPTEAVSMLLILVVHMALSALSSQIFIIF